MTWPLEPIEMSYARRGLAKMINKANFIFEETSTGCSAYSLDFPGVGVAAESHAAAEQMLIEAIALHLEDERLSPVRVCL